MINERKYKALKLIGFILCAVGFVLLAVTRYFFRKNPPFIDACIRDFFYNIRGSKYGIMYWIFSIVTEFGNFWVILFLLIIVLYKTKGDFRFFLFLFGSMLSVIIVVGMKDIYSRERPIEALQWATEDSKSFPSGHSAVAGFTYTYFIYLIYHTDYSKIRKRIYFILLVLLIILVMISRLVLGVHYFTDVLAGCFSGIMVSCLCMLLFRYCLNNDILTNGILKKKKE